MTRKTGAAVVAGAGGVGENGSEAGGFLSTRELWSATPREGFSPVTFLYSRAQDLQTRRRRIFIRNDAIRSRAIYEIFYVSWGAMDDYRMIDPGPIVEGHPAVIATGEAIMSFSDEILESATAR